MSKKITVILICACVFPGTAQVFAKQTKENNSLTYYIFQDTNAYAAQAGYEDLDSAASKRIKEIIAAQKDKKAKKTAKKAAEIRSQEAFEVFVPIGSRTFPTAHEFIAIKDLEITKKNYTVVYKGKNYFSLAFTANNKSSVSKIYITVSALCEIKTPISVVFSINKKNELVINFDEVLFSSEGNEYFSFGEIAVIGKVKF